MKTKYLLVGIALFLICMTSVYASSDGRMVVAQADSEETQQTSDSSVEQNPGNSQASSGDMDKVIQQSRELVDKLAQAQTAQQEIDQAIQLLTSAGEKFNRLRDIASEINGISEAYSQAQGQQTNDSLEQLITGLRNIQDKLEPLNEINNDLDSMLSTLINGSPQKLIPFYNSITELMNLANQVQPGQGSDNGQGSSGQSEQETTVTQDENNSSDSSDGDTGYYDDSDSYYDDSGDVDQNGYE